MKAAWRTMGVVLLPALLGWTGGACARDGEACRDVRLVDVGWSDNAATTGLAAVLLEGLGYRPVISYASVRVAFQGMKQRQADAFLGYWKPSMSPLIEPHVQSGHLQVLPRPNLEGAKYTLAVPDYLYEQGLKSFSDIARFGAALNHRIHGIDPGTGGNALIQRMIDRNEFGLAGFKRVESSENGMLNEVRRAAQQRKAIVFLGWEPHPMNLEFKIHYLEGGDALFGPNFGEAKVYTVLHSDYARRCPNAAALLSNLRFAPRVENEVMAAINDKTSPVRAAREWLRKNPAALQPWLQGVTGFTGNDAAAALRAALGGEAR